MARTDDARRPLRGPAAEPDWPERRRKGIPPRRRLWVLTCMDERIPVERLLGLRLGDAHVCRNAGGIVTEDALRSAMISTRFAGARRLVVINHTDCGLLHATGEALISRLEKQGVPLSSLALDPDLPELALGREGLARWCRAFADLDALCLDQIERLKSSPLIPPDVVAEGYIFDCATMKLRRPRRGRRAARR